MRYRIPFNMVAFTREEWEKVGLLNQAIGDMAARVMNFGDDVDLFEEAYAGAQRETLTVPSGMSRDDAMHAALACEAANSQRDRQFRRQFIAARDALIQADLIRRAIQAVDQLVPQIPKILPHIDHAKRKAARDRYDKVFYKNVRGQRNIVAHGVEDLGSRDPEKSAKGRIANPIDSHGWRTSGVEVWLRENLTGNKITGSVDGEILEFEISMATLQELVAIVTEYQEGFAAFCVPGNPMPKPENGKGSAS